MHLKNHLGLNSYFSYKYFLHYIWNPMQNISWKDKDFYNNLLTDKHLRLQIQYI